MGKKRHYEDSWVEPRKKRRRVGVSPSAFSDALAIAKGDKMVSEVFEDFAERHEWGVSYGQERTYARTLRRALVQMYHRGQIDESELDGARLDISDYMSGEAEAEDEEKEYAY